MLIHEDRLFPAEPSVRSIARALYEHVRIAAHRQPARAHAGRLVCEERAVSRSRDAVCAARPLCLPDALQPGSLAGRPGDRAGGDQGSAQGVANFRQPLLPFSRNADAHVAGLCLPGALWSRASGSRKRPPTSTSTPLRRSCRRRSFCPARFTSDSILKCWRPPILPSTRLTITRRFATQDGRRASCRLSGLIRWSIRSLPGFAELIAKLGEQTGEDTATWEGYLNALRKARARFRELGCTATDHGHPTAQTADLSQAEARSFLRRVLAGKADAAAAGNVPRADADRDGAHERRRWAGDADPSRQRAQSQSQGLSSDTVATWARTFRGPPTMCDALRPLLDRFGNEPNLTIILFTLDESTFSRELAPLAGHYPCLRLGPPWWFLDSPEGMMRFRELATETAGFYNTVGFNDDTRAFLSIPARHDVARRIDCAFLARLVAEHRLDER